MENQLRKEEQKKVRKAGNNSKGSQQTHMMNYHLLSRKKLTISYRHI